MVTRSRPKALPQATPETQPFWDGCKLHELRIQFCNDCKDYYFYPRRFCPTCLGENVEWRGVSGKGTLHTYVISHRAAPGFEEETPYVIAVVKLAEGPHLMSNVINVEVKPENLPADLPLEVVFVDVDEATTLPKFQPAKGA